MTLVRNSWNLKPEAPLTGRPRHSVERFIKLGKVALVWKAKQDAQFLMLEGWLMCLVDHFIDEYFQQYINTWQHSYKGSVRVWQRSRTMFSGKDGGVTVYNVLGGWDGMHIGIRWCNVGRRLKTSSPNSGAGMASISPSGLNVTGMLISVMVCYGIVIYSTIHACYGSWCEWEILYLQFMLSLFFYPCRATHCTPELPVIRTPSALRTCLVPASGWRSRSMEASGLLLRMAAYGQYSW